MDNFACNDCGHSFYVPGTNLPLVIEGGCPECGGNATPAGGLNGRPEPDQPSPTQSDGALRNLVDPHTGEDSGGNPLQEGILGTTDGGWASRRVRDESFASVRQAAPFEGIYNDFGKVAPGNELGQARTPVRVQVAYEGDPDVRTGTVEQVKQKRNGTWEFLLVEDDGSRTWIMGDHPDLRIKVIEGGAPPAPPAVEASSVGRPSTEWVTPMRIHPVASNQTPQMPWAFEIEEVAEPGMDNEDAEEKINGEKESAVKQSFLPALAPLAMGALRMAAPTLMRAAVGQGIMGAGKSMLGIGGGGNAGAPQAPAAPEQARPLEMMASGLDLPGGGTPDEFPKDTEDPEKVDPKEHNDGDTDGTLNDISVNDIGGSADPTPGLEAFHMLLPLVVHYAESPDSALDHPLLSALHDLLTQEGHLEGPDDHEGALKIIRIVKGEDSPEDSESEKSENSLPDSDGPDEDSSKDEENQPSKTAADHQGPHSAEQIAAVAQKLVDEHGYPEDLAYQTASDPTNPLAAEILAELVRKPDLPSPDVSQPQPAQEEAPPEATMPMPGMEAPPLGQMTGSRTAEHDHATLDSGATQGVPAADQLQQEDRSREQDSSGQWQTDDGDPLIVGEQYELRTPGVDIPDVVRVQEVKPDSVTLEFTGAYELGFAKEISRQEFSLMGYSFSRVRGDEPEANAPVEQQGADIPSDSSFDGMSTGLGEDPHNRPLSRWNITAMYDDDLDQWHSDFQDAHARQTEHAEPGMGLLEYAERWVNARDPQAGEKVRLMTGMDPDQFVRQMQQLMGPADEGHFASAKESFMPGAPGGNQPGGVCSKCGGPLQPNGSCAGCERSNQAPGAPGVPAAPATPQNPNGGAPQQFNPFGVLPGGANASRPPKSVNGPASYSASVPSVDPETGIELDAEAQATIARLMRNASMDPSADEPMAAPTSGSEGLEWLKEAGAQYSPNEQRDLIDEEGEARNADKLDLSNTHYESRRSVSDDASFLW